MTRPLTDIRNDIQDALTAQADVPKTLEARITALTNEMQRLSIEVNLEKPNAKADLFMAYQDLQTAKDDLAKRNALTIKLADLNIELVATEALERQYKIDQATKGLETTLNSFHEQSMQLCRTYQLLLIEHQRYQRVEGTKTRNLPHFTIDAMIPTGYVNASTSEMIRDGSLYWLKQENAKAA